MEAAAGSDVPGRYPVIRTRFFDDFLLDACQRLAVRQVVLAAAGLDTRAFRLQWPARTRLYEIDLPAVLNAKEDTIVKLGQHRTASGQRSQKICSKRLGRRRFSPADIGRRDHQSGL
jgi:methyltransferase (TIGR00027 family)